AFGRIGMDDHMDLGHGVAVDHVVGNPIKRRVGGAAVLAEVRVEAAIAIEADDVVHDGGGVGRHGSVRDLLVPGIVRREELRPEESGHDAQFEFLKHEPGAESPLVAARHELLVQRWHKYPSGMRRVRSESKVVGDYSDLFAPGDGKM